MKDVEILRQSIRAVTQILAESDIKVTQQGMDAYTVCAPSGKINQINLPYLPDDATDDLIAAVQGYLDHEVGHALFTDFEVVRSVSSDLVLKNLHNIVEDAFVERKMVEKFRGCAYNLQNVGAFYREKHLDKVLATGTEDDIKKSLIVAAIRSFSGQEDFTNYMSDKWHLITEFKAQVEPLAVMLSATRNSQDCLDAAKAIKEAITPVQPPKPESTAKPEEDDEHQEGDESTQSNEPSEETSDSDGNSESDEDTSNEGERKADEELEGESEQVAKPEPEESEEEAEPKEDDGDDEGEGNGDSDGEEEESEEQEEQEEGDSAGLEPTEASGEESEEGEDDMPSLADLIGGGLDGGYSESLATEVADKAQLSEYLIYTDEHDRLGLYEEIDFGPLASDTQVAKFEKVVNHMLSPIQKDIERAICARSASTHTGGFRSGKLHSSALSRLATGDDRIFRRKQINTTKDVAVSLVVDCSGSMGGAKMKLAAYSAFALSSVLDRLGITHEMIGFTTERLPDGVYDQMSESARKHNLDYSRYESLVMPIFKGFREKMSMKVKRRLANLNEDNMGSNADGESIAIAAKRLMAQKEKGKIMIVLSDGYPQVWGGDIRPHLKESVKRIELSGINVVGIGIESKAVEEFYSKSIYVDDVEQLPTVVGKQLKAMLLG